MAGKRSISLLTAVLMSTTAAFAQTSGSAVDRRILPPPDQTFTGQVGKTLKESTPAWAGKLSAPAGAPNVLLIMTDDVGFADDYPFDVRLETVCGVANGRNFTG